ncbi:dnaJ homolog subfamily C member 21-like [Rhinoraja longicauda]
MPAVSGPTMAVPTMAVPAVSGPTMAVPAVSGPTMAVPAVSGPTMAVPAVSGPAVSGPTMAVPAVSGPTMAVPAVSGPTVSGPTMAVPAVSGPTMAVPAVSGPTMAVPAVSGSNMGQLGEGWIGQAPGSGSADTGISLCTDKNPDCPEDAAEQFKLIQAAYDVLSDPQERAWYDSHREAILRGGQDGEDDSHELLQYFTGACYSGFTDSPQGFYAVYRAVFVGIAEQEVEGAPSAGELTFPTFGHAGSDYQTVVHGFYAHWQSFCTSRTLSWSERFDTRHADNRWHRRAMEKENRRARERARRQYNQLVQQLAAFVRRRDPRVHAHRQHLQQVNAQKHQRAQQLQRQQAQRQARLAMEYQEQSWVKLSDLERELRQMEAQYQQEFGDGSEEGTSGEEDGPGEGEGSGLGGKVRQRSGGK